MSLRWRDDISGPWGARKNLEAAKVHRVSYAIALPNYDDQNDVDVVIKTGVVP